jgi:DNA modification methylase
VNLQQAHVMVFAGIGFKFSDLIQGVHRIYRFLQTQACDVHLIYTAAERTVRRVIERKWQQHTKQMETMTNIIREFGLSRAAMAHTLTRKLGIERVEVKGERFTIANNDCVDETVGMDSDSVGLVLTSIPFSTQYEYSPSYNDFGHTDSNEHFWQQMDFLTPQLLRVLAPGRLAAIHVKDRIVPGGMTGLGFQTVYPFHADAISHFRKHGFGYMGMKTIVTDVVRENNQTYRLGWSEQCKDATKMGVGMPEYLLIFRKPPTDRTNSYADQPVVKLKPFSLDADGNMVPFDRNAPMVKGTGYSRSRWQIDAHGFTRSSGNRLLTPEELIALPHEAIFKLFKRHSLQAVYDFEHHVALCEALEAAGKLPVTFMLMQPQSWSDEVWADVTRMLTLNGAQSAKGKEMHLCPMQFDLADRAIAQWTNPGEEVYDPFGGLMTVPYRAIKAGRRGRAAELNPAYFIDGVSYCQAMEREISMPSLFDALETEAA